MNKEQIAFLREVVKEVRMALANQSMDTKLVATIELQEPFGFRLERSSIVAKINFEKK